MCLIIDTCCLATVFDGDSRQHAKFEPVLSWIQGKGRMIYGGTKYNTELGKASKYLAYVVELARSGRAIRIPDETVDTIAASLKVQVADPEFNDEHILTLVITSQCCVVCTQDKVAMAFLKRADLFPQGSGRPKIFSGHHSNRQLCCDKHVVGVCKS
jgi:hypothetical protein